VLSTLPHRILRRGTPTKAVQAGPKTVLTKWLGQPSTQFWLPSLTCMVYGSLNNPPVSALLDHRWHGCTLVEKIGVQIVVLSRELHTSMSALASSELGCSPRGLNYWRIGCIKMVAPMGSLLTGSSSTFCFVALNLWHLLALCPARCIGLRSAKTLLDGGNSWKAKSPRKLLRFRTHIVPHHLAA
jgi:hypothetical protein